MKLAALLATILASSGVAMCSAVPELVRRQTDCTEGSAIPNPAILTVGAGVTVNVAAQVNAGNIQQLTVVPGPGGLSDPTPVIFQGKGDDLLMPIISGGTGDGFTIPPQSSEYLLTLVFAFSRDNGATFNVPIVQCPISVDVGKIVINAATSEDSIDNDDNDTIAIVVFS